MNFTLNLLPWHVHCFVIRGKVKWWQAKVLWNNSWRHCRWKGRNWSWQPKWLCSFSASTWYLFGTGVLTSLEKCPLVDWRGLKCSPYSLSLAVACSLIHHLENINLKGKEFSPNCINRVLNRSSPANYSSSSFFLNCCLTSFCFTWLLFIALEGGKFLVSFWQKFWKFAEILENSDKWQTLKIDALLFAVWAAQYLTPSKWPSNPIHPIPLVADRWNYFSGRSFEC